MSETVEQLAAKVKLLVFDVDGVMTDGGLYYGAQGELFKRFDVKDGHALVMARLTGLPAAILTARSSEIVEVRGKELGLVKVLQGKKDKSAEATTMTKATVCDGSITNIVKITMFQTTGKPEKKYSSVFMPISA